MVERGNIRNVLHLFLYFHCISKKNIYLCHTLSAHQRGETCGKRFLFFREYVKFHLSESKFSDFNDREVMRQIFHANGLYQHIRNGCVIYKQLAWMSVVIIILSEGVASLDSG